MVHSQPSLVITGAAMRQHNRAESWRFAAKELPASAELLGFEGLERGAMKIKKKPPNVKQLSVASSLSILMFPQACAFDRGSVAESAAAESASSSSSSGSRSCR